MTAIRLSPSPAALVSLKRFALGAKSAWASSRTLWEPVEANLREVMVAHKDHLMEIVTTRSVENLLVPFLTPWAQELLALCEAPPSAWKPWIVVWVGNLELAQAKLNQHHWQIRGVL